MSHKPYQCRSTDGDYWVDDTLGH